MKSIEWKTYRTRFLVKAKQLNSSLSFTDHLGRQHCGRRGDYLVESCDGVLTITPRPIFEDVYVAMGLSTVSAQSVTSDDIIAKNLRFEPLRIEEIKTSRNDSPGSPVSDRVPRSRKSPQPVREAPSRLSLM